MRLAVALVLGTVGSVGMWSFVVALPAVQADFGVARGDASLPFTLTMIGFGVGGIVMGRLADRFGIVVPVIARRDRARRRLCAVGHRRQASGSSRWRRACSASAAPATFGPLMTDISHWFVRRRGIAVAIVSCGNYLAGTIWPPIIQHFIATDGWRATQIGDRHRLHRHDAAAGAAAAPPRAVAAFGRRRCATRRASSARSASRRTR